MNEAHTSTSLSVNFSSLCDEFFRRVERAEHIVLSTHREPDGDGIGSALALAVYLELQNKSYSLFSSDTPHPRYSFLKKYSEFSSDAEIFKKADLCIVFDAGDVLYTQLEAHLQKIFVVNVDHHASNTNFGSLNIILEGASSTCEIMYRMFFHHGVPIHEEMATSLLLGMVLDTGNFSNPATTQDCLLFAGILLEKGARYHEILRWIFENQTKESLRIWGRALERLSYQYEWGIVSTYLLHEELNLSSDAEVAAGLSNFFNNLQGVRSSLVLKESEKGVIKGSFRTTEDGVDLARLAEHLGAGGGHKKASGFRLRGSLKEVEKGHVIVV